MKHSSHQIRGKCTYYFALEPGITFHHGRESSGSSHQSPRLRGPRRGPRVPRRAPREAAAAEPPALGRGQSALRFTLVLGDLKTKDLVNMSL